MIYFMKCDITRGIEMAGSTTTMCTALNEDFVTWFLEEYGKPRLLVPEYPRVGKEFLYSAISLVHEQTKKSYCVVNVVVGETEFISFRCELDGIKEVQILCSSVVAGYGTPFVTFLTPKIDYRALEERLDDLIYGD